jgi:hypothetical protein
MAPDARNAVSRVRDFVVALGTPLLAAGSRAEFERALDDATTDPQLPHQLVQVVRTVFELDRRLLELDPIIDIYTRRLGEEHRWKIRQIFNMSLEIMLYARDEGISLDELIEGFDAIDIDKSVLSHASLENFVCASAVACAVEYPSIDISDTVRGELVDRWYETATAVRGEIDPLQSHIDALHAQRAQQLPEVRRLTYTHTVAGRTIWALCDAATEPRVAERLEQHLQYLGDELGLGAGFFAWAPIRVRSASARGPAEDLLRGFETLDELFESPRTHASWAITSTAEVRLAGHERLLGAVAERLAEEVANRGYRVIEFSLTAHISPEAPSNEVLLELTVAGLPDTAARIELWGQLSDLLAEDKDPFVVERLAIVVRRIID